MNLNNFRLNSRVDKLSAKLVDKPNDYIMPFDPKYCTEAEKAVFLKLEELEEEFGNPLPHKIAVENKELIFKASEIMFRYAGGTFRFILLSRLGDPNSPLDKFYLDMEFIHFLEDIKKLKDRLTKIHRWPEYQSGDFAAVLDREDSERELTQNNKTECSEESDNEHYDPDFYRS